MSADPVAVALLERARRTRDDLEARLLLAAAVQRAAEGVGVLSVVTGGTAVDFYVAGASGTSATYPLAWRASADVDLVAVSVKGSGDARRRVKEAVRDVLGMQVASLGRTADGVELLDRALYLEGFGYGVEIVADEVAGDPRAERVWTVEVDGHPVTLQGPEDTLIAYAESGWHFHHPRDWERALGIFAAMKDEMDLAYLQKRARERHMPRVLAEAMAIHPLPKDPQPLS
ncbi:MAG TPA: hypothetical protein VNZ52_16895 [Candidatus Thermoplasmatota archaeon]|nr:hypothetical protein [Candidatus Thermoplasmatota archaeon]